MRRDPGEIMSKVKVVDVGLTNIEGVAGRAAGLAQVWARQIGRTHGTLYEALGQCLVLYRVAKRDHGGFLQLCEKSHFVVSTRARDQIALGVIRLAFDPTPVHADARCRYSMWAACLLGLDQVRPTLRTAEAAKAQLERSGVRKIADLFRDAHREPLDKADLIRIEETKDRRIRSFMTRAVPLAQLKAPSGLRLALIDSNSARLLDLNPTEVRKIVSRALE